MLLAAQGSGGSSLSFLLFLVLIFGAMYFLMIRPQQKRRREAEQLQRSIAPGDEVITVAGLYGTVRGVDDDTVTLEVAPGVTNRYARGAIARVVTPRASGSDEASDVDESASPDVVDRKD
ncbi:MAG TPA: preprotein translocase subunit YajC [Micromonosporaceae bacterium]